MPHWDFECENGHRWDLAFASHADMKQKSKDFVCPTCREPLELCPSSPGVFAVYGFNAMNHYGAKHTDVTTRSKEGYKVSVKEHTQPTIGRSEDR